MSKKSKKKGLSDKVLRAKHREKPVEKKLNPFELKFNKQKHAVAGQKKKATVAGLPLQSRHRAFEERKRTLLNEYRRFGKANEIVDRRLGERNPNLTPDQKMALRFATERRRRYKGEEISPADDRIRNFQLTGVDSILTHRGKSLSEIEKLNERPLLDDDEEEGGTALGADFVKLAHFGGGNHNGVGADETAEKKKSRKELIEEMITNSKRARYELQMQREKASDLTSDLDAQWKEAVKDNLVSKWIRTGKEDEVVPAKNSDTSKLTSKPAEKPTDYDRLVHEMTFEPKAAKGSDKRKDIKEPSSQGDAGQNTTASGMKKKIIPRTHITGDDDIFDLQRFKREKEKPFVVQYNSDGQLIQGDVPDSEEPPVKKSKKSVGIEFLEPRIESGFNPERKKRQPAGKGETVERQKMMQKYKQELRGTMRELRRDNQFLARQQLKDQQELDSERKRKVKDLMKSLVSQETECNKLKRKKNKL